MDELHRKYEKLREYLATLGSAAVAFSGGVDSTFLLAAAVDVLGGAAAAITASSEMFPFAELSQSVDFCRELGVKHIVVKVDAAAIPGFAENPVNRCYLCKRELFGRMLAAAEKIGISTVCEGSNTDDLKDYRPGLLAIKELGVKSPLRTAGLSKADIRVLSRELGLPTWSKPSFACLASRFVYGEAITPEKLRMVEKAEELLLGMGFTQERVRIHGTMARIEILPEEFERMFGNDNARKVNDYLRSLGFSYVSLDLGGYRTGSMNLDVTPIDISKL